jgi:hypothetical protein
VPPSEAANTTATMERRDAPREGGPPLPLWRPQSTTSAAPWEGGEEVGRGGDEVTVPASMRRLQGGAATPDPPPVGRSPPWSGLTSTTPWE